MAVMVAWQAKQPWKRGGKIACGGGK
jgi:hypothetical protein